MTIVPIDGWVVCNTFEALKYNMGLIQQGRTFLLYFNKKKKNLKLPLDFDYEST